METIPHHQRNVIFILSLPRSGSTLLQHIIASHPTVISMSEPWLLFPAAAALQPGLISAEYNVNVARSGLIDFIEQLDGGEEVYFSAVRQMMLHLYNSYSPDTQAHYFLDKTPRYYLILSELLQIFPKAKFIFLLRNPLAIFYSILKALLGGNWRSFGVEGYRSDVVEGLQRLDRGIELYGDRAMVVHYEKLVSDPEATIHSLCEYLGIDFQNQMLDYGRHSILPGVNRDRLSIDKHDTVVSDYVDKWKTLLSQAPERTLARAYLESLGSELVQRLGYDYESLLQCVPAASPRFLLPSWETVTSAWNSRSRMTHWKLGFLYYVSSPKRMAKLVKNS